MFQQLQLVCNCNLTTDLKKKCNFKNDVSITNDVYVYICISYFYRDKLKISSKNYSYIEK